MKKEKILSVKRDEFDYILPPEKIAQYPLLKRDESKLLIYQQGWIISTVFKNIAEYLPSDSYLIFNNTKVIKARLFFHRPTGAKIEIFCLEPVQDNLWKCFVGNHSKWKEGIIENEFKFQDSVIRIRAEEVGKFADEFLIRFEWDRKEVKFGDILEKLGRVPLPPYIRRQDEEIDTIRYQTEYAEIPGSVAAPTAGLHFTDAVFDTLRKKNIDWNFVTLNVGAGTFKPVKVEKVVEHKMHSENLFVMKKLIVELLKNRNKVFVSVGTTVLRVLESLYWLAYNIYSGGTKKSDLIVNQFEYLKFTNINLSFWQAMEILLDFMEKNKQEFLKISTSLMIVPGYEIVSSQAIITNFHLPQSTLLMLIAAFIGDDWRKVYRYALDNDFRFLSYGDTSLLFKS
ncbi:MAG: S-adenosylmethionine:tRNA ribosyltransferase-isomerase [Ignavibacteria bacterium]